jgi:hypothetical protein
MKVKFIIFFILLSSFSIFGQHVKNDSLNVLFLGNSYTHMNNMPAIFEHLAKSKGKLVHVEKNTQSGASFRIHSQRMDMFQTIKSRKWDYIVLQGYSRELSWPKEHIDTATIPYLNQILDSIHLYNPCVNLLLYNTWGYKNGFKDRPEIDSYDKMQDSIILGYKYLSNTYNIPIVPVGMVWRNVRQSHPEYELYKEDNEHPTKLGSLISASTFYAAIFKESAEGVAVSKIEPDQAKFVQKEAAKLVLLNYEKYNLTRNRSSIKYYRNSEVKYILECKANYPEANCIMWEFGDGSFSFSNNPVHTYKKAGKYVVKLYIDDACGERYYEKKIIFVKPSKPSKPSKSKPVTTVPAKKKI